MLAWFRAGPIQGDPNSVTGATSSSSLEFSHCIESGSSLLCGHYKLTSVMKTWIEMSGNGI